MNNKLILGALALTTGLGVLGGTSLNLLQANAQSSDAPVVTTADVPSSSEGRHTAATDTNTTKPDFDPSKGGHVGTNGTREELLTGDTAAKVTAAALAKVTGGKIERVETDAEGAAYEAHMTNADGAHVTVKLDSNFNVTSVENGRK